MQIIELYIKGYNSVDGSASSVSANKLIDSTANFTDTVSVGDLVTNLFSNDIAHITAIDSATQLSINADIFSTNDVYKIESNYERCDLFEDESVTITESLVNVRDIGKVFTPFSQQFNLPASKTNNKIFRHYENTDIENSFDARFRHNAIIKLNGIDFRKGQIQFRSVSLKNNVPHAYKVVFYGETVELKEILGDSDLSSLNYGDLDFDYTQTNITKLMCNTDAEITTDFGNTDILVPNIHHSKNMRYDTTDGYKDNDTGDPLKWTDVKPAIRVRAIIDAINRTYPGEINITGFLQSQQINDIYMWMHRNEGFITNADEGGGTQIIRNRFRHVTDDPLDYTHTSTTPSSYGDVRSLYLTTTAHYLQYEIKANVFSGTSESYTIRILRASDESIIAEYNAENGGNAFALGYIDQNTTQQNLVDFIVEVQSENTIAISSQTLQIKKLERASVFATQTTTWTANYNATNFTLNNTFYISKQIPKMKVMDFLSGLFKMFNLVVFKDTNGDISTFRSPWYMSIGSSYDITKYVDMETSNMERLFQYREMEFKFKSKKSFLVQFADEINQIPFSQENYGDNKWDGGVYKVELPFEKMMYERLTDEDDNLTAIGQGAMLNKQFEPTIGEPLLLCLTRTDGESEWEMQGTANTFYRRPSQLTSFDWSYNGYLSLNFGEEIDEYLLEVPNDTVNLFDSGYFDYVDSVFDRKARLLKVSAYLPLPILIKLKMNDSLVIANKSYRINSIKTNLLTNKSDLELYNKDEYVSQIANFQTAYLGRISQLNVSTKSTDFITVSWDAVTGATGYNVYLNGGLWSAEPNTTTTLKVNNLEGNTWYNISVRVKYDVNGNDGFSFDTGITEKTN